MSIVYEFVPHSFTSIKSNNRNVKAKYRKSLPSEQFTFKTKRFLRKKEY
ncbi:MAG: hypothetical protein ACJA01_002540 [Saprospiraceae bacterium]|jgi:hypothetical protein